MRATVIPAGNDPEPREIESGIQERAGRSGEFTAAITQSEGARP